MYNYVLPAIYTGLEHLKENLLQEPFLEVVYFQKSSVVYHFLPQSRCS